jgi:hypothetical protein
VEVVHAGGAQPLLFVNGGFFSEPPVVSNPVLTSWMVPLEKGMTSLEVRDGQANDDPRDVRHIEVR